MLRQCHNHVPHRSGVHAHRHEFVNPPKADWKFDHAAYLLRGSRSCNHKVNSCRAAITDSRGVIPACTDCMDWDRRRKRSQSDR